MIITTKITSKSDYVRILIKKGRRVIRNGLRRKQKRSIIFDACERFHYFHIEPIIRKLIQDNQYDISIIKWNGFKEQDKILGINYISFDEFWHDMFGLYDILVSTELERRPGWFTDGTAICMFHGAGPKISYLKNPAINDYNILFCVGPTTYDALKEYVNDDVMIEKIGLPITDSLTTNQTPSLPKNITIDYTKPTLLYAPSWSLKPDLVSMDEEILYNLSKITDYNIIIRPHPNLLHSSKCGGVDWAPKLNKLTQSGIQISYSADHSVYELLPHIDILLGDISSVTYEFLILDRPIILYMKDHVLLDFEAENFIQPLLNATNRLQDAGKLDDLLVNISLNDNLKQPSRKFLLKTTLFNVGSATSHAVNALNNL